LHGGRRGFRWRGWGDRESDADNGYDNDNDHDGKQPETIEYAALSAMTEIPSAPIVNETLRAWIRARTGISITEHNQAPVELAVRLEAERHGLAAVSYLDRLLGGLLPPQAFIDAITTNESYFFRALDQMRVTVMRLIPELLRHRASRPVRILSLPCARGEEPYSLAILCEEHRIPPRAVELVAGDISATCLADARRGEYGPLAFRRTDPTTVQRWFTPRGPRTYRLEPALCGRVAFHQINLLEDAEAVFGQRFDIVFCENLLIYFDAETTAQALGVIARLLTPDGWLFVDPAEWNLPRAGFRMQELDGCVGFRPVDPVPLPVAGLSPAAGVQAHSAVPLPGSGAARGMGAPVAVRHRSLHRPAVPAPPRRPLVPPVPASVPPPVPLPGAAHPLLAHAEAHYQAKRFSEALLAYEAILAAEPQHALARLGRARVLADCGEDFEALETAETLVAGVDEGELRLPPADYVEALVLIALLLHKKGLKSLAQGYLREVERRAPDHPSLGLLRQTP
jgi:chemotaxis protein methyltransferase WspC